MSEKERSFDVRQFFAGLTEHTFYTKLGVPNPRLIDYLTELLTRFVKNEVVFRIRGLTGRPLTEVAQMMMEAEARLGDARRDVHQHIGDFILFWSGVYPEALKKMRHEDRMDHLVNYWAEGKRAYHAASEIQWSRDKPGAELLDELSDKFELCAYGLGEVRREWERRDDMGNGLMLFG